MATTTGAGADRASDLTAPRVIARSSPLSRPMLLLLAAASGLAVANAYFAHPLLDVMAADLGLSEAAAGLIVGATQVGYGLGLVLLVPLGDRLDRRRLIVGQSLLTCAALLLVGLSRSDATLLGAMAAIGFLAVIAQTIVAFAAGLAHPAERGRVVGFVTSGIVVGILLARSVAGTLTDLSGWRTVYFASAILTLALALALARALPPRDVPKEPIPYLRLVGSLATLFAEVRALRVRAVIGMGIFANVTTLLAPLVLPLSAPPFSLSHMQVGLFGLAGAAGALGAAGAGRWADRGHAERTTGVALSLMLASWGLMALLPHSILWLIAGVVVIDFGLQATHVTNQSLIYRVRPEAQSRLAAAYMVFYAIGSAVGSSVSVFVYARAGWNGVCLMGAAISVATLAFWWLTLPKASEQEA